MAMTMTMMRSSARCIRGGGVGRRLRPPPARPERRDGDLPKPSRRNFSASGAGDEGRGTTAASRSRPPRPPPSTSARPRRRWLSASSAAARAHAPRSGHHRTESERRRRSILAAALERVRDEGWTADAVAAGTLDAGFPPSYVGRASESTSAFGSAELVAFFMEECNARLREELAEQRSEEGEDATGSHVGNATAEGVSSRIAKALRTRLSMVLPYVASERWHEGMAIGALPQNAYGTSQQLDEMATIVLDYALGKDGGNANPANPAQRAAVVAAYAAAELHLLSDGKDAAASGGSPSLSGERYHATWAFLEARAAEAARFVVDGGSSMPSFDGVPLPNPTHVMAASAVASSLAGAALSLAAPSVAAMAGHAVPRAMSMLAPLQDALSSQMSAGQNYGTRPSDYAAEAEDLPPFDTSEEIFPEGKASNA